MRGAGEPAALHPAHLLADRVHRRDRRARCEKRPVQRRLVLEPEPVRRRRQERRAPAADERHDEVVPGEPCDGGQKRPGRRHAGRVGHGMRGLEDAEMPAGRGIAVARDDDALDRVAPEFLEGRGHLRRTLARADHHRAPLGTRGQRGGKRGPGVRGADGRVEEPGQEGLVRGQGHAAKSNTNTPSAPRARAGPRRSRSRASGSRGCRRSATRALGDRRRALPSPPRPSPP